MGRKRAAAADGTISKTEAVKAALADGVEKPQDGAAFIKERFGLDVTPQMFSQTKSLLRKKEREASGTASGESARLAPASSNGHHAPAAGVAQSVEAIKRLVGSMGVDEVIQIAELFRR